MDGLLIISCYHINCSNHLEPNTMRNDSVGWLGNGTGFSRSTIPEF